MVGFNGDRDWTVSDGGEELGFGVLGNVFVAGDRGGVGTFLGVIASFVRGLVWVVGFGIETTVLDDVFESVVHEATLAGVITFRGGAVHQLLFGERSEFASGDLDTAFGGSSGGERPA